MRTRILTAILLGAATWHAAAAVRAAPISHEDELKAAYLFNFAKLVDWPPSTSATTLTICFVGGASVSQAFERTAGHKQIEHRQIVIVNSEASDVPAGCNIVYFEAPRLESLSGSKTALTVSDARDFAAQGGMIELFSEGNRLRFNINLQKAQKAGLRISSNLLQLAAHVNTEAAP